MNPDSLASAGASQGSSSAGASRRGVLGWVAVAAVEVGMGTCAAWPVAGVAVPWKANWCRRIKVSMKGPNSVAG